jgi:hypothetical protein
MLCLEILKYSFRKHILRMQFYYMASSWIICMQLIDFWSLDISIRELCWIRFKELDYELHDR